MLGVSGVNVVTFVSDHHLDHASCFTNVSTQYRDRDATINDIIIHTKIYQLQDCTVTLDVIIQIQCCGYQIKAGNLTFSRMHLTLKKIKMVQFYKLIELIYIAV